MKAKSNWYILLVQTGYENFVLQQLKANKSCLKFEQLQTIPEYSGYVLVKSSEVPNIKQFLVFDGIINFLGVKKNIPQVFTNKQIELLKNSEEQTKKNKIKFKIDELVEVKRGIFSGIEGRILEINKDKVKIMPAFLKKPINVNFKDIEYL